MRTLGFIVLCITLLTAAGCGSGQEDTTPPIRTSPVATTVATPTPSPIPTPLPTPSPVPSPSASPKSEARAALPILYYHAVSDKPWGLEELFVKPAQFDAQMAWLVKEGYTAVTFDDFQNLSKIKKPVLITFDDGYADNATVVYPILKKYNLKATVFLTTGFTGERYLSEEQVRNIKDRVMFEGHTVTHPEDIRKLSAEAVRKELDASNARIQELTGRKPVAFAYPVGLYNDMVVKEVGQRYRYAVENGGGYSNNDPLLHLKRIYVPRALDINGFISKVRAGG